MVLRWFCLHLLWSLHLCTRQAFSTSCNLLACLGGCWKSRLLKIAAAVISCQQNEAWVCLFSCYFLHAEQLRTESKCKEHFNCCRSCGMTCCMKSYSSLKVGAGWWHIVVMPSQALNSSAIKGWYWICLRVGYQEQYMRLNHDVLWIWTLSQHFLVKVIWCTYVILCSLLPVSNTREFCLLLLLVWQGSSSSLLLVKQHWSILCLFVAAYMTRKGFIRMVESSRLGCCLCACTECDINLNVAVSGLGTACLDQIQSIAANLFPAEASGINFFPRSMGVLTIIMMPLIFSYSWKNGMFSVSPVAQMF